MFERGGIIYRTLLSVARQRPGLDAECCRAMIELLAVAKRVGRRIWFPRGGSDLGEPQFMVLVVLFALHPAPGTPAALADYSGYTRSTVSRLLPPLEKRGWIARSRSTSDARNVLVRLTSRGRATIDHRLWTFLRYLSSACENLKPGEVSQLTSLCARLAAPGSKKTFLPRSP